MLYLQKIKKSNQIKYCGAKDGLKIELAKLIINTVIFQFVLKLCIVE